MRKQLTLICLALTLSLCLSSCFSSSSSSSGGADFQLYTQDVFGGKFYPSLAIWNASQDDYTDLFYTFTVVPPKAGAKIRITIEATSLNEESVVQAVAEDTEEMVITPIIKWNYDKLAHISQNGNATMTCILNIDGEEVDRINHVINYTPINDCVFGMVQDDEWLDLRELFALYVNEDYPEIDKILQEILSIDATRQFFDTQGTMDDAINQIYWIWEYFSKKGTRYSNVINSSTESELVGSQSVRFIDQTLNNNQANCVDGSVMLASIYRKVGFDCYLVFVPGHCKLAIYLPSDGEYEDCYMVVETTLMGSVADPEDSFDDACLIYSEDELDDLIEEEEAYWINIQQARADGIMPISRNTKKN